MFENKIKKPVNEIKETIKLLLNQNKGGRILFPMHLGTLIFCLVMIDPISLGFHSLKQYLKFVGF